MRRFLSVVALLITVSVIPPCVNAQVGQPTEQDSMAIVTAEWKSSRPTKVLTLKQLQTTLFNSAQSISLVEISPRRHTLHIAGNAGMLRTSQQAENHDATVAINGTYYNMRQGNSVCFYMNKGVAIDSTSHSEFASRVNGAVILQRRKVALTPWSYDIERTFIGKRKSVLASGPLLIEDGEYSDWSRCDKAFIETRHPRSAMFIKNDGTIVMLTVDGRSKGNAAGMNIPELAYLVKMLGGKEGINLDGGGSTTLWVRGEEHNGVVNYPCDNRRFDHEGERSVSNIIYAK